MITEGRGAYNVKVRGDEQVLALQWVDNKTITMASTCYGAEPFAMAKLYTKTGKRYIDVQMPNIVKRYNVYMGGVVLHNRMIAHFRSYHRTIK